MRTATVGSQQGEKLMQERNGIRTKENMPFRKPSANLPYEVVSGFRVHNSNDIFGSLISLTTECDKPSLSLKAK